MAFGSTKFLAVVSVLVAFASGCGSVAPERDVVAQKAGAARAGGGSPSHVAEINRNIASAALSQPSTAPSEYRIGPEDLLEITLFNVPEAHGRELQVTPRVTTVRVSYQGQISLPVVGEVDVRGLTVSATEQLLRQRFDKYIHNPQIGVLVREFRQRVSVIGAVQKPGAVELTGPKSVIEILALAGGISEKAGSQVHIYRQGKEGRETSVIDLAVLSNSTGLINAANASQINMMVEPGDMINVPEAGMFFVEGAVRNPGSYPLGRRYTLTQALATAGGIDRELNASEISIFRRTGPGQVETIALNVNAVMEGTEKDPQIEPDDVIILPISTGKYIVKRFIGTLIGGMNIGQAIR